MARSLPFGLQCWIWTVLLGGCAAVSATPNRVVVRLYDARSDVHLGLANASHPELQGLYSRERERADLKLCRDKVMARLLDGLEDLGFERFARPGAAPGRAGLKGWIQITRDEGTHTFVVPEDEARAEALRAFASMKLLMDQVYGTTGALQFVRNPDGRPVLGTVRP